MEIADYYHEVLKPNGFVNSQGMQIIGIDSWDNLSTDERIKLCKEGGENGQTVGLYFHSVLLVVGMERQNGKHPVHGRRLFPESER